MSEGGWKRDKRGLCTRGNPGRVESRWSRGVDRLGLITERRRDESGARGVRRGVGLWRWWVHGRSWIDWRSRNRRWSILEVSGRVLSSTPVGPDTRSNKERDKKLCEIDMLRVCFVIKDNLTIL